MTDTTHDPYHLLVENAVDYAVFTTDPTGVIRTWNPGSTRIHGFTADEMVGERCDVLFTPEDREAGIPELERSLALRAGRAENERWHVKKDGSRFWGAGIMVPLRTPDGRHVGFGKMLRDFTRRRQLEAAHLEAQRMESVGVLAGGVAHLFNNLLTASLGNLDLLLRVPELRLNRDARHLATEAIRANERMAELTHQILAYAGRTRRLLQPLDLRREVQDTIDALGRRIPPNVAVSVAIAESCPPIQGDAALLRQLLTTLILNAVEALSESAGAGGSVRVTGEPYELTPAAAEGLYQGFDLLPGTYIRLDVTDTGPGLTAEAMARAFEPFYSTKFQGRGLGLAAALGIARMHGGAITVRSVPYAGATFEVLLPAAGVADAARGAAGGDGASGSRERLALVVDDEELVRSLMVRILEAEGFTAVQAENGDEALRIARRVGTRVGVVILDWAMPIMDGATALPKLRELLPGVPIVLMTGMVSVDVEQRMSALAPEAIVQKPFTFDQLTSAVQTAMASAGPGPAAEE